MTAQLPPLPVAVPLLVAALLTGAAPLLHRRWADLLAILTAAATTVLCALLLRESLAHTVVYWFSGWHPRNGVALGICFAVDPFGAGLATLAAALVTLAFVFSWRYFGEVGTLYHGLMLVFLAAMAGFCLSGDLFNLFVFFELMGTAAYALTGYKVEARGPLEGALNFAVTNSVGAFMALTGLTLLYARTGALNPAQIGRALAGHPADGLVITAFVLLTAGLLIKGAVVPFHFWLDDAHAVAPTPVSILFSGVMVTLGLYGAARVYWTVFADTLGPHAEALRSIFVGLGALTILVGAAMCVAQRHLKRLLAFSTISHMGVLLIGIGLLTARAAAGAALYALAHGTIKAALFFSVGILLNRYGSVDEDKLRGRAGDLHWVQALFILAGLGLAGLPPFGTSLGKSLVEAAGHELHLEWLPPLFLVGAALTGGAILRAAGRVFWGWGRAEQDPSQSEDEQPETQETYSRVPFVMLLPVALLVAASLAVGLWPGLRPAAAAGAQRFLDQPGYLSAVLDRAEAVSGGFAVAPDLSGILWSLGAALGAVGVAAWSLFGPPALCRAGSALARPLLAPLRALHSGVVGDYVVWVVVGTAVLGGLCAFTLR